MLRTPFSYDVVPTDPYCLVSFHTTSDRTRVISETVCPTWDQTILMKSIRIFGDVSKVVDSPPPVIIEFMDKDTVVSGRGLVGVAKWASCASLHHDTSCVAIFSIPHTRTHTHTLCFSSINSCAHIYTTARVAMSS